MTQEKENKQKIKNKKLIERIWNELSIDITPALERVRKETQAKMQKELMVNSQYKCGFVAGEKEMQKKFEDLIENRIGDLKLFSNHDKIKGKRCYSCVIF